MQITWKRFHAEYTEEKVKRYVPSNAGIYLLCVKLKNGTWRCFYVGQTNRLDHRLLEHLSDLEENDCIREAHRQESMRISLRRGWQTAGSGCNREISLRSLQARVQPRAPEGRPLW